jgi:hypothetical protein
MRMQDLRLVAVTPERSHLVLEDDDNAQFRVPIDERLTAVMRRDHSRPGQLEIALESPLTPRDIQARIRAGQSAQDVAAAAGMAVARIERYAGPVIAEREHVAAQAKAAPSRRQSGGTAPSLGDLVASRLADQHVASDSVVWDAWRADDDTWTIHLSYLAGARERVARWIYDPRGKVVAPDNDEARWLVDEEQLERDETPPSRIRRLAAVPLPDEDVSPVISSPDEVFDIEARTRPAEPTATRVAPAVPAAPAMAEPAEQDRPRQVARAGRHPAVPSWDDIMFGARRRD